LPLLAGDIDQALKGKSSYLFLKETDVPVLFFSSPLYGKTDVIGSVRFLVDLRTEAELLRQFTYVFTGVFLILIVIAVWTARRMAKTLIGPIDDLRSVSHALTKGHYAHALPAYPYEELNRLAADFSTLADAIQHKIGQLEQQRSDQQTFIDHITHELRTPMTAIMGYVELIPKLPPDEAAHCYHYIEVESQRLLRLVSHNLEQAQQQRNDRHATSTMFALDALLADALFIMQLRLDGQGIQVKQDVPPIYVLGQPDQTKQVLSNLLENAVKYSDAMTVTFSTVSTDTTHRLIMTDDGIGVDPAVLAEWEKEQHSLTTASGNGLGLPLCRRLMQEQGGDFELESDITGTRITLTFRLANQT
jgi:signal transduction histidine kinase